MYILEVIEPLPIDFFSWKTIFFLLASYVYGSIPFAFLFTFLFTKKKLNETGTGNIGIANAFGVGGFAPGFLTVAGDASKGILPILVSHFFYDGSLVMSLLFITVGIIGHGYSFFLKGRGGQGGTILLWALLILSPYTLLLYFFITVVLYVLVRRRRLASSLGYAFLPLELLLIEQNVAFIAFGAFAALYYIVRYNPQQSDYAHYKSKMKFLRLFAEKFGEKSSSFIPLTRIKNTSKVGSKAYSLRLLKKFGQSVPVTYVCPFSIYKRYRENDLNVIQELRDDLHHIIKENTIYSVRSSANLEDSDDYSFSGQFSTYLNVKTAEDVINAIVNVWNSTQSEHLNSYLRNINRTQAELEIAVIVQEMVHSRFSGVVFTRNPVTGFDEIIIEVVSGLGERLNQPGAVIERWVYKWGNWREMPSGRRKVPKLIFRLVEQAKVIARKYGKPVDLEWAYDGRKIYWLQIREITTVKGVNVYSNKISKEFMPGIIKPLVWSVNIPVVNSSWKRLFIEMVGRAARDIDIDSLAKQFYYRSYFNMGIIGDIFELLGLPRESIEIIMGFEVPGADAPRLRPTVKTIRYLPRMMLFAIGKLISGGRLVKFLRTQPTTIVRYEAAAISSMSMKQTFKQIEQLMRISTEASYYVIISQLLMGFYTALLRRLLSMQKVDIHSLDFTDERDKLRDIDINHHLSRLHEEYESLPKAARSKIATMSYKEMAELPDLAGFYKSVEQFITVFGHMSESGNDFSRRTYRESLELLLEMIASYSSKNVRKGKKWHIDEIARGYWQRPLLKFAYKQTMKFRVYRERVNFLYTRGYLLFRPYFIHLAALFKARGFIQEEDDIFYLALAEVKNIASTGRMKAEYKENLRRRKWEIARYKNVILPNLIVGDTAPTPHTSSEVTGKLKGVAAAKGYREGKVKVVSGLDEFGKVDEGDIIVIPHSDVSWTPIFTKAKAIISESGGMLSHCAIVAREYNIPAVVSVTGVMNLKDGTRVRVDGYAGEVIVL